MAEKRRRRPPAPSLPRLRPGEIPGIRPDSRPYATIALVLAGLAGCLLWRTTATVRVQLVVAGKPGAHWWRLFAAAFAYNNTGYAFAALGTIALFGWLLERRHGPLPVLALFLVGGVGGVAATAALYPFPHVMGANGAALAMVVAWAIPDLLELRAGAEIEGDLIGAAVIAAVVALMPLAAPSASWVADGVGVLGGLAIGLPLARLQEG